MKWYDVHNWSDIECSVSEQPSSPMRVPYDTVRMYGIPFMKGLVDRAQMTYGASAPTLWIDCDVYPGVAMSAIRHGLTHLIVSGDPETCDRLKEMVGAGEISILQENKKTEGF